MNSDYIKEQEKELTSVTRYFVVGAVAFLSAWFISGFALETQHVRNMEKFGTAKLYFYDVNVTNEKY